MISAEVVRSPGWWTVRLSKQLLDRKRINRLDLMADYLRGDPPLPIPTASPKAAESFSAILRKARSNFAELVVAAPRERMVPNGFRTGADGDETGDAEAWRIWQRAGLDVESVDVHTAMLALGEAYVIVGNVDPVAKVPVITYEDPRHVITVNDPLRRDRALAGLKIYYDDIEEVTRAYLYLPGRVFVATSQPSKRPLPFSARTWSWDEDRGGEFGQALGHDQVPVVRFANYGDMGEFEAHIDLLDRINHQILQRMVIATMQAFRQRAVKGLPDRDDQDNEIDWSDVFTAHPGSLWQVPDGVDFWESQQADVTPILTAVDKDVQHLAAVTRTPMSMLLPAGANQSAEGASFQREGLVFKANDRIARATQGWSQVMSLAFLVLNDPARADMDKLRVIWAPAERRSLSERADAASKLATVLPWRTLMTEILNLPADQVDRLQAERVADALQSAMLAPAPVQNLPAQPVAAEVRADANGR